MRQRTVAGTGLCSPPNPSERLTIREQRRISLGGRSASIDQLPAAPDFELWGYLVATRAGGLDPNL